MSQQIAAVVVPESAWSSRELLQVAARRGEVGEMDHKIQGRDWTETLARAGGAAAQRHVFVCIGPECCQAEEGEALWEVMKQRIKQTGAKLMRTRAACLRVCTGGPWMVVYPEGVWYSQVTTDRFEVILQKHLLEGRPVEEWSVARNALCLPAPPPVHSPE